MSYYKNVPRLQHTQHEITQVYPSGVSQLIFDYFLDAVIVTAEYHWAVYDGNVTLLRQIDKNYNHLLMLGSYKATDEEHRATYLFKLLGDALDHDQVETATYLRQEIGLKMEEVWEMQDEGGPIDKNKQQFLMDMTDEKKLTSRLYVEMTDHNNIHYVKTFLQRFFHFHFARADDVMNGDAPVIPIGECSNSMVYILLRYAKREDMLAAAKHYFDDAFNCFDDMACLLYAFDIDYTICSCQKYLIMGEALEKGISTCRKCKREKEGGPIGSRGPISDRGMRGPRGHQG